MRTPAERRARKTAATKRRREAVIHGFGKTGVTPREQSKQRLLIQRAKEKVIKIQVRIRDGRMCRCCEMRRAESVHEIVPKSLGGVVSFENSIYVCGLMVGASRSCHTYLQQHQITVEPRVCGEPLDANQPLRFTPVTDAARKWLGRDE